MKFHWQTAVTTGGLAGLSVFVLLGFGVADSAVQSRFVAIGAPERASSRMQVTRAAQKTFPIRQHMHFGMHNVKFTFLQTTTLTLPR
jgi:hypothetical protein